MQTLHELTKVLFSIELDNVLRENIAGVDAFRHPVGRDSGDGFSVAQRPKRRLRTSVLRQERRMIVHNPELRDSENRGLEYLWIHGDDGQVDPHRLKTTHEFGIVDAGTRNAFDSEAIDPFGGVVDPRHAGWRLGLRREHSRESRGPAYNRRTRLVRSPRGLYPGDDLVAVFRHPRPNFPVID